MTISPTLLTELEKTEGMVERKLDIEKARASELEKMALDQKKFRWLMNENEMASEQLAEGIRKFTEDIVKLESLLLRRYITKYETI
jgi:transaldolase